jgi:hypothetical protein
MLLQQALQLYTSGSTESALVAWGHALQALMPSKAGSSATTTTVSTAATGHQSKVMFKAISADSAAATRASLAASIAAAAVAGEVAVQKLIVLLHMVQCSEQTGRWSALPALHRDALQVLALCQHYYYCRYYCLYNSCCCLYCSSC